MSEKMRFIRKNGKVIPIGPKKNGENNSKPRKRKVSNAEKSSFHSGKAIRHVSKMNKSIKKGKARTNVFGLIGAIGGALIMRKKSKTIGAIAGLLGGGILGTNTGKHGKNTRKHAEAAVNSHKKASKYYRKTKNKDEFGDGESRRAYRRGLSGSSV